MLYLTIGLFAIAAVMGVINLKHWMGGTRPPRAVVYVHGLFAASALVLLLVQAMKGEGAGLRTSLVLFIIAALGGFYLFSRDLQNKIGPGWLAMVHGLVAVTGFVLLLLAAF
jgi:glucose uptake protein GlcU